MGNKGTVSILITARDQATRILAATAKSIRDFGAKAKTASFDLNSLTSRIGELAALGGVALALKDAARAADEFAASQKSLAGAAKLTGAPLDFVQDLARQGRENFSLGASEANNFASELVTLAAKTGDLGQAQGALNDFLNLGAAQGLKTAETLDLLSRAANGDEKAIKKFVNLKPDQVFEAFASKIGKTVDQLTEGERTQALFNIAAEKGKLVQGEYAAFLQSTQGKLNDASDATENLKAKLGTLLGPTRELGAEIQLSLVGAINNFIGGIQQMALEAGVNFALIGPQARLAAGEALAAFGSDAGKKMVEKAKAEIKVLNAYLDDQTREITGVGNKNGFDQKALTAADKKLKTDIAAAEAAKKKAEAEKNAQATIDAELQLIDAKIKANKEEASDKERLDQIEDEIQKKLEKKNLTLQEQLKLQQALVNIESIRQEITQKNVGENLNGPRGNRIAGDAGAVPGNLGAGVIGPTGTFAAGDGAPTDQALDANVKQKTAEAQQAAKDLSEEMKAAFTTGIAGSLESFFGDMIKGFDNAGDAVKSFGKAVANVLSQIAAQAAANALLKQLFGAQFGGNGGGLLSFLHLADGGLVSGPGGPRDDMVMAALSNGEGVLTAKAVAAIGGKSGIDYLNSLSGPNAMRVPRFADGGVAGSAAEGGRLDGSITVGLGEGLVLSQLDSPAGSRGLIKIVTKTKNAMNAALGR